MVWSILEAAKYLSAKHKVHIGEQSIRRLYTVGQIPEPPKVGRNRVLMPGDLERIEEVLRDRGDLPR